MEAEKPALKARNVGDRGKPAAAKKEGFQKGDVIVEVAGSDTPLTETELLAGNLLNHRPGDKVPVVVLRGGKRIELKMPIQ